MKDVDAVLNSIDRVRPFPEVVQKAMVLLEDPDVPAGQVLGTIQYDPVITMRLLQVCNSAIFGMHRKVHSLQQGLVLLGNQGMMRLLVAFGALDYLKDAMPGYGLQRGELWDHAVACATMTQTLLKEMDKPEDYTVFTGGLLHDIGKILLSEYAGRKYEEIARLIWEHDHSSIEAERLVLGIDHAQLGGILSERWNLPDTIVTIIARHHEPVHPDQDSMSVCLVHLANVLCLQLGIGAGDRGLASRAAPDFIRLLGWSPKQLDVSVASFWSDLEKVKALMEIPRAGEA
jgi:putative nucleotidyltransferase with HDIG domain